MVRLARRWPEMAPLARCVALDEPGQFVVVRGGRPLGQKGVALYLRHRRRHHHRRHHTQRTTQSGTSNWPPSNDERATSPSIGGGARHIVFRLRAALEGPSGQAT